MVSCGALKATLSTAAERSYKHQLPCNHVEEKKKTRNLPFKWKSGASLPGHNCIYRPCIVLPGQSKTKRERETEKQGGGE